MKENKTTSYSKYRRSTNWKSDPEYDKFVSGLDMSSLRYLKESKKKQIFDYKKTHDLSNPIYKKEYERLRQSKKMIDDEYFCRSMDILASSHDNLFYNSEEGIITNSDGKIIYTIDFDENEESYIIRDVDGNIVENIESDLEEDIEKSNKKRIYQDWNYYEC